MIDFDKIENIELDGIDFNDYPDFCDAYVTSAEIDGRDLTEAELDEVNDDSDFVYGAVMDKLF